MRIVITTVTSLSILFSCHAYAGSPAEEYNKANLHYSKGEYERALEIYTGIRIVNPDLEYNIGSAYFATGNIGKARLHFERSLKLRPSDEETIANIDYIKKVKPDRETYSDENVVITVFSNVLNSFPIDNGLVILLVLYLTTCFVFGLGKMTQDALVKRKLSGLLIVALTMTGVMVVAVSVRLYNVRSDQFAVAVKPVIHALSAPVRDAPSNFSIHEGAKVRVNRVEGDYAYITLVSSLEVSTGTEEKPEMVSLRPGLSGWVDRSAIERI